MIEATTFAGQNWVITPAARAVNDTSAARIQDQKWLLVLSGVVVADVRGNSGSQWRHETVSIRPDLNGPLQYAIGRHGVPTPPGTLGGTYWVGLQVEQWSPFVALSSMFNKDTAVNSGHAVDAWRPNPFGTGQDAVTSAPLNNLFQGVQADVAVRDTDAFIHRFSYNITLIGKIVFGPIIIT